MIKSLKAYFLGRLLREKILLLGFILLVAAVWGENLGRRAATFLRQQGSLRATLAMQESWLGKRAAIEARTQQGVSKLDPARTLNATRLLGEIGAIVREAGIDERSFSTAEARPERSGQFAVNSLRFSVNRGNEASLQKLYEELQKRSPYIGIDEFSLQVVPPNRVDPLVNYQFRVSSVEIAR